jgi:hypothetical protein
MGLALPFMVILIMLTGIAFILFNAKPHKNDCSPSRHLDPFELEIKWACKKERRRYAENFPAG